MADSAEVVLTLSLSKGEDGLGEGRMVDRVTAAVMIIGDEILSGRTQDVNLSAIAKYLATYGVLPGRQGKGIGKRLMDAVLRHAGNRPEVPG